MKTGTKDRRAGPGLCRRWVLYCIPIDLALSVLNAYATGNNGNETGLHIMTSLMTIALNLVCGALVLRHLLARQAGLSVDSAPRRQT